MVLTYAPVQAAFVILRHTLTQERPLGNYTFLTRLVKIKKSIRRVLRETDSGHVF